MKIGLVTAIKPAIENRQSPSFLVNYYYHALSREHEVSLLTIGNSKLNKLGMYSKKISRETLSIFDAILVYPSSSLGALPISIIRSKKIFILGPDSAALLFTRFTKNPNLKTVKRLLYLFLQIYFQAFEILASKFAKFLVVGEIDATKIPDSDYIEHPYNLHNQIGRPTGEVKSDTIVLFGDLSPKYTLGIVEIANIIEELKVQHALEKVVIIGKSGLWIHNALSSLGFNSSHLGWVDDLEIFLEKLNAVHFFPLLAGAGTKNRVQLSIRLRAPIVGTTVAFENIGLPNVSRKDLGLTYINEIGALQKLHVNCVEDLEDKLIAFNNCVDRKLLGIING